jgi:hypothetical protein
MSNEITLDTPLWLRAEDVMKILECSRTVAFEKIKEMKDSCDFISVGAKVPTNIFSDYSGLSIEFIGKCLSKPQIININPPITLTALDS